MPRPLGCCQKYQLLLWKDFKLQLANIFETISIIVMAAVMPLLVVIIAEATKSNADKTDKFVAAISPLPRSVETSVVNKIYFSPRNALVEEFIAHLANATSLKNFTGFGTRKELQKELIENTVLGIAFPNSWSDITSYPEALSFTIYPPANIEQSDFRYFQSGFLLMQEQVTRLYIKLKESRAKVPKVIMRDLPYPEYTESNSFKAAEVMAYLIPFSFCIPCITLAKYIVAEKENQQKAIMKTMGIQTGIHWLAWYTKSMIMLLLCLIIVVIIVVIGPIYNYGNWLCIVLILLVYIHCCTMFAFLVSAFCSKSIWALLAALVLYVATALPYMVVGVEGSGGAAQTAFCLALNSALLYIFDSMASIEAQQVGIIPNTIAETASSGHKLSIVAVMVIMFVVSLIELLICLYLEQVKPGEFGVPQAWFFPCQQRFWCPRQLIPLIRRKDQPLLPLYGLPPLNENSRSRLLAGIASDDPAPSQSTRAKPEQKTIGVQIKDLCKTFGSREVVKDLSFDMYKDEITVVVGHNGAGKTTTILMLCGMLPPTSGTAVINGYDIVDQLQLAKNSLGVCPQHGVIFKDLNVKDHIYFFCRVKGFDKKQAKYETYTYIRKLKLDVYSKQKASKLSAGDQRRLSLACALCGGSKVILCDEPSSGLDPKERYDLWRLLQKEKKGRCVLLTTNQMDEGEVLGDRIGIMSNGQLQGYGTLGSLKTTLNTSYTLSCEMGPQGQLAKLTELVTRYVPTARPSVKGSDVNYKLTRSKVENFSEMFRQLEENRQKLDVVSFGLTDGSLEEVASTQDSKQDPRSKAGADQGGKEKHDFESQTELSERAARRAERHRARDEAVARRAQARARPAAATPAEKQPEPPPEPVPEPEPIKKEDPKPEPTEKQDPKPEPIKKEDQKPEPARKPDAKPKPEPKPEPKPKPKPQRFPEPVGRRKCSCMRQFEAMTLKKFYYFINNPCVFLPILAIPLIYFIIVLATANLPRAKESKNASVVPLTLDYYNYDDMIILLTVAKTLYKKEGEAYASLVENPAKVREVKDIHDYTFNAKAIVRRDIERKFLCGATFTIQEQVTAWYNSDAFEHSAPIAMNLVYNALGKAAIGNSFSVSVSRGYLEDSDTSEEKNKYKRQQDVKTNGSNEQEVIPNRYRRQNEEYKDYSDYDITEPEITDDISNSNTTLAPEPELAWVQQSDNDGRSLLRIFMISVYICLALSIFAVFVTVERVQQLRLQQQLQGLNSFCFWSTHFLYDYIIFIIFMLALTLALYKFTIWHQTIVVLLLIGVACLPFIYLCSLIFRSPATSFVGNFTIQLMTGPILFAFTKILYVDHLVKLVLHAVFALFPLYVGCHGIMKCLEWPEYCTSEGRPSTDGMDCHYGTEFCACKDQYYWPELYILLLHALIWFLLLCFGPEICSMFSIKKSSNRNWDHTKNRRVLAEEEAVAAIEEEDRWLHPLILDQVNKNYCWTKAVKFVSFSLKHGECFGLLGASGAGKTSIFKMIVDETSISSGNIYINGYSLQGKRQKARRYVGYCPQSDILHDFLTGRQTLMLYCLLQGVPRKEITTVSEEMASDYGYKDDLDKKTKTYCGGTKRKLCASMTGKDKTILCLDEPNNDMDPSARQFVCKKLESMAQSGRAVLLTSRSMEEVGAICSRVALLDSGEVKSIGSLQQVRAELSNIVVLKLRINGKLEKRKDDIAKMKSDIESLFRSATLMEALGSYLKYHIPKEESLYSKLFKQMEIKMKDGKLEDYSITQASLDEIFMQLNGQQTEVLVFPEDYEDDAPDGPSEETIIKKEKKKKRRKKKRPPPLKESSSSPTDSDEDKKKERMIQKAK